MTDETDNDNVTVKADSGRGHADKSEAIVHDSPAPTADFGEDTYLVEYPDGSVEYEPNTPVNVALFEDDLYNELDGYSTYGSIELDNSVQNNTYYIGDGGHMVAVDNDHVSDLIDALQSANTEEQLSELYHELIDGEARRTVVEKFAGRFDTTRIDPKTNGWVVDDTFIVKWNGENYLTDDETVYIRSGGEMVQADERKQAVDLQLAIDGQRTVDGTMLTETEQAFLATVECLLYPEDYLDAPLVDGVRQARDTDIGQEFGDDDPIGEIASQATVTGFTDTKTRNHHGGSASSPHTFNKHRASQEVADGNVESELGMTADAVDKLYFHSYDHAAPHELLTRRDEFENAPFDIFEDDVANDDTKRWTAIKKAANNAPISQETREKLNSMFGA